MSRTAIPRAALRLSLRQPSHLPTRPIDPRCRIASSSSTTTATHSIPHHRAFTTTPPTLKKAGKANKAHARSDYTPSVGKAGQPTPTDEAYDMSGLENQILKAIEKLSHDLSQLRSGGRLNPDVVEGLKVKLGTGAEKESVRLGDVAQVVPRGRVLNVIVGDQGHIKPVSSAIAASPHSLTPLTPEPSNPLTIQVPLPPPTGESRRAAVEKAGRSAEQADKWIQSARQTHHKKLRKFQLDKEVLPDDLQKAGKEMEDCVKKGHAEVKLIVDGAKRVLESQ